MTAASVKLVVFSAISATIAALLMGVLGAPPVGETHGYKALFDDVSGLESGSSVRIAGVNVGRIDSLRIVEGNRVLVDFSMKNDIVVTRASTATIRYKNLIGDRFIEISQGPGSSASLGAGATIPPSQTSPALDVDTLLNGFKPLFHGLSPDQINELSTHIVRVFQGESANIGSLLSTIASLTETLADRDELIGSVIDNLDAFLGTVAERDDKLASLIVQIQELFSGLADDRKSLGASVDHVQELAGSAAGLLADARPDISADLKALNEVARTLNENSDTLTFVLNRLPDAYKRIGRVGAYGDFYNFFVCSVTIRMTGLDGKATSMRGLTSEAGRCQ